MWPLGVLRAIPLFCPQRFIYLMGQMVLLQQQIQHQICLEQYSFLTMPLYRQHKPMRVQHLFICTILVMVFFGQSPTTNGGNSTVTAKNFYIAAAFRLKYASDSSQRGLMYVNNTSGTMLFRAYVQNGQVKCFIRQVNGTTYTVTVPNLNCAVDTWYKLEISRDIATSQFKVKVGVDEVTQTLTADFANPISRVDVGVYWDGNSFIGYFDRFIYQPDSITPY